MIKTICFILTTLTITSCHDGNFSFSGTVKQIETGKDGYTALIKDKQGKQVDVVISRNKMSLNYETIKVGDIITVYGDSMHLGNKISIRTTKIKH